MNAPERQYGRLYSCKRLETSCVQKQSEPATAWHGFEARRRGRKFCRTAPTGFDSPAGRLDPQPRRCRRRRWSISRPRLFLGAKSSALVAWGRAASARCRLFSARRNQVRWVSFLNGPLAREKRVSLWLRVLTLWRSQDLVRHVQCERQKPEKRRRHSRLGTKLR